MILGLKPDRDALGWALLDDAACSFVDLGVVSIGAMPEDRATLVRAVHATAAAATIAVRARGCTAIVIERTADLPTVALVWGAAVGVIATLAPRPRLLTIAPERWWREVRPNAGRVDYADLARSAAEFLLAYHPAAHARLTAIKSSDRNYAIDAAMLALVGALQAAKCDLIEARGAK